MANDHLIQQLGELNAELKKAFTVIDGMTSALQHASNWLNDGWKDNVCPECYGDGQHDEACPIPAVEDALALNTTEEQEKVAEYLAWLRQWSVPNKLERG